MLGVTAAGNQTPARLLDMVRALPHINRADVAVSAGVILVVLAARTFTRRIPGPLIPGALTAVIIAIGVSWATDLASRGVAVVGPIPGGLPSFGLHSMPRRG